MTRIINKLVISSFIFFTFCMGASASQTEVFEIPQNMIPTSAEIESTSNVGITIWAVFIALVLIVTLYITWNSKVAKREERSKRGKKIQRPKIVVTHGNTDTSLQSFKTNLEN